MKKFWVLFILLGVISCSSNQFESPFDESTKSQNDIAEHLSQGEKYVGGNFDSKFTSTGRKGTHVYASGKSFSAIDNDQSIAEKEAIFDAKNNLVQSAPSEFKSIVQRAIGNETGGSFSQVDTSVTEIRSLTGIEVKNEDIECKVKMSPLPNGEYKTERECRALARVSVGNLKKAYDFTIESKYKVSKEDVVNEIE